MRGRDRSLVLTLLLGIGTPAIAHAQISRGYLDALRLYERASFEKAILDVNQIPHDDVLETIDTLIGDARHPDILALLRVAFVLHADAAGRARMSYFLPDLVAGPAVGHLLLHENAVGKILPTLRRQSTDLGLIRNWYKFTLAEYQIYNRLPDAGRLGRAAPKWVLDDPEVMLALGAVYESAWRRRHEDGDDDRGTNASLDAAERSIRAALASRPEFAEAQLRLARIQTHRNEFKAALATLAAVQPGTDKGFAYLARLFEGDALEALGDRARAREAYQAAVDTMPDAQSARTALAHLLHAGGDRRAAAQAVNTLVAATPVNPVDPWLIYSLGTAWRSASYIHALRVAVVRKQP